jgi:methionyl-tRNA formyltransferase
MASAISPLKRNVIFLNGQRGVDALVFLISKGHHISAVVTPSNFQDKNLDELLKRSGIKNLTFRDINSKLALEELSKINSDLFIVAGYSSIFSKKLLSLPQFGCINLHAGKLPNYRGGSPLNWQIINGEKKIGLSVIALDEGIDSGPVYSEILFDYQVGETIADLHLKANSFFPQMLEEAISKIEKRIKPKKQSINNKQYWHQRSDRDGKLKFDQMTSEKVINHINALTRPYQGAWAKYNSKLVRIYSAKIFDITVRGSPGRICYIQGHGPIVICIDKAILLTDYFIEDGGKLKHGDYLE